MGRSDGASGVSDLEGSLYVGVQNCGRLAKSLDCNRSVIEEPLFREDLLCARAYAGVGWGRAEVGDGIIRTIVPMQPNNL